MLSRLETRNRLIRSGARSVSPEAAPVHVSGHGASDELRLMLRLVRPRFFAPIHGEIRHQKAHAEIATSLGLSADRVFLPCKGHGPGVERAARAGGRTGGGEVRTRARRAVGTGRGVRLGLARRAGRVIGVV